MYAAETRWARVASGWCRSTGSVLFIMLAATLLCPPPSEAQWPTTDWRVLCYDPPLQLWLASDGSGDRAAHGRYRTTLAPLRQGPSCDDSDPDSMTGKVRANLRQISQWLEGQGFPAPNLPLINGRFEAVVVPPDAERVCYKGRCADGRPFYAYVGSTTPAQNRTEPNVLVLRTGQLDQTHELFHAVQHAFDSFQSGNVANWVKEGTAEAVGRTWSKASAHGRLSPRDFSESLHRRAPPIETYDDEAFWRAVSREYTTGETYAYLVRLFSEQGLAGDELAAVERTLGDEFGLQDGLAEVYPQVVARHLEEERFYGDLAEIELAFPDTVERPNARAAEVGTDAYRVRVEVPQGEHGELIIRVPSERDEEYLHLSVDDRRFDDETETRRRNEFVRVLSGGRHEFLVRLANVPRQLGADAASERLAPIEFILNEMTCYWRVSYSGAKSGQYEGSYVYHWYDDGTRLPGGGRSRRLTRQIAGAKTGVMGFTISFSEEPLTTGMTGHFTRGVSEPREWQEDGYLSLGLGDEFTWRNNFGLNDRPFTVHVTENDDDRVAGTFQGVVFNKGDLEIAVEGEFDWRRGECTAESD